MMRTTTGHLLIPVLQTVIIMNQMNFRISSLIFRVSSYFHLNCHSLNINWEGFRNLLCDFHGVKFAFIGISGIFGNSNDGHIHLPGYHDF